MAGEASTPKTRLLLAKNMVERKGGTTIPKMMEEMNVSRWTARRLIDEVDTTFSPVEEEWRDGEKWFFVSHGSRAAPINMTQFEMIGVSVARQIARYLEGTPMFESLDGVFEKISTALNRPDMVANLQRKIYDVNEGAMRFTKRDNANLQTALDALLRDNQVLVRHVSVSKGRKEFLVDPLTLLFHRKGPYLVGRSHYEKHKGALRKFAFDGVRALTWCKGQSFTYPPSYHPKQVVRTAFGIVQGKPERIRIRFRAEVERSIRRRLWHATQRIGDVVDGWFPFEMTCAPSFEVRTWVLGWGKAAEIIEPARLREEVSAEVVATAATYGLKLSAG